MQWLKQKLYNKIDGFPLVEDIYLEKIFSIYHFKLLNKSQSLVRPLPRFFFSKEYIIGIWIKFNVKKVTTQF